MKSTFSRINGRAQTIRKSNEIRKKWAVVYLDWNGNIYSDTGYFFKILITVEKQALKLRQEGINEHHKSPSVERGKWFRAQDSICEAFFMMYKENEKLASQEKFRTTLLRKLGLSSSFFLFFPFLFSFVRLQYLFYLLYSFFYLCFQSPFTWLHWKGRQVSSLPFFSLSQRDGTNILTLTVLSTFN